MVTTPTDTPVAGRELDALVAERVMGLRWNPPDTYPIEAVWRPDGTLVGSLPFYSTDTRAAWEVVEHRYRLVNIRQIRVAGLPDIWSVIINDGVAVENESAPLAICLAALQELDRRGNH